jgi:hypothetical protein
MVMFLSAYIDKSSSSSLSILSVQKVLSHSSSEIPAKTSKVKDFSAQLLWLRLSIQTRTSYTDIFDGLFSEIARGFNWYEVEYRSRDCFKHNFWLASICEFNIFMLFVTVLFAS